MPEKTIPKRRNLNQPWVDAVRFALSECLRFQRMLQEAVRTKQFESLPKDDMFYGLRHPKGHELVYGREADRRLFDVASDVLRRSDVAHSVNVERVFKAIKAIIVERFIMTNIEPTLATVEKAFAAALKEARKARADSRHLIPCQLMLVADPENFAVGPVKFHNCVAFKPIADALLSDHRKAAAADGLTSVADDVLGYYAKFTWVADVTVIGCDKETGGERALQAVNAALDFLHIFFGHFHSHEMRMGGPGLDSEIRGMIEVREGETSISYSRASTSAVGFKEGWAGILNEPDSRELVASAGRAIEAITNPETERPLGLRFINSAAWHGQAVRESSPAAAIIKSVSALESMVLTEKSSETARVVCERSAAMSYDPNGDARFDTLLEAMKDAYDLRSRLLHGTLSPYDPEVKMRRNEVLRVVERCLTNGLAMFDHEGLLDRPLTPKQLAGGLEDLIASTRQIDSSRHPCDLELMSP